MKSTRTRESRQRRAPRDPAGLIEEYHRSVAALFGEFRAATAETERRRIAERICHLVAAQCEVEQELLYPEAARLASPPDNRIRAAQMEGAFVRKVVDEIRRLPEDDRRLAATLDILHDYLDDYVDQQRAEVLPRLRRAGSGTSTLYEAMLHRRNELLAAAGRITA
jgi:hypothetical protein